MFSFIVPPDMFVTQPLRATVGPCGDRIAVCSIAAGVRLWIRSDRIHTTESVHTLPPQTEQ
jgi:hypothetical protein